VQRPRTARLMAGMWELPEIAPPVVHRGDYARPALTVRHSITVTDYTVHVWREAAPDDASGKWVALRRVSKLPLTGLARKILGDNRLGQPHHPHPSLPRVI
jgi:hypothetical protein